MMRFFKWLFYPGDHKQKPVPPEWIPSEIRFLKAVILVVVCFAFWAATWLVGLSHNAQVLGTILFVALTLIAMED